MLPILLLWSKCLSLTREQSQRLELMHSSCLQGILVVRLSDWHTGEDDKKGCEVVTLQQIS